MHLSENNKKPGQHDDYLYGPKPAWFAFAMTLILMVFDYLDRQIIVSLFPHIKAEYMLSDKQLGLLVSVVSITVALGGIPIALIADRVSRVKSIVVMASAWSLATISCMFTTNYSQLLAARAVVGVGEAGYGSVGAALISSHFPSRLRSALLAGFFASASVGSVLGVMVGGYIAEHWGWKAAFGVVGVPGLIFALLYLFVKDYKTVELEGRRKEASQSTLKAIGFVVNVLARSRTMLWVCIGGAAQLIVVSSMWSWVPSYLNRFHGFTPQEAGIKAAVIVLCGALGSVVWGAVADRAGRTNPLRKLLAMGLISVLSMLILMAGFGLPLIGIPLSLEQQFPLIAVGGFIMTCTVGPASAVIIEVTHPGVRATGASVLSLFQNMFGLALGPFLTGVLSDWMGLKTALVCIPMFSLIALLAFLKARGSYIGDMERAASPL